MQTTISKDHARRFLLRKHGLQGPSLFQGKKGVLSFVRQVGCIQYDPVDVCGKSHELALFSRVSGFTRDMLRELLYEDRSLIDYWDKNMSILAAEDWPYLEPTREQYRQESRGQAEVDAVAETIRAYLAEHGHATSQELPLTGKIDWYWSPTSLSRAALETLYFRGDLMIHHKRHTVKSYALAESCLSPALLRAENPCKTLAETQAWQALRRIGAVGLLWNRASDAWLGIPSFKGEAREHAFESLAQQGKILPVQVEGIPAPFYHQAEDLPLLKGCESPAKQRQQVRFLPPLDCLLWDRKLISALFGFDYKWEIYTPLPKRVYSYYVLPVLYGEGFAGRVEPICDRKNGTLILERFWPEKGFRSTAAFRQALEKEAKRLAAFHGLETLQWREGFWDARPAAAQDFLDMNPGR